MDSYIVFCLFSFALLSYSYLLNHCCRNRRTKAATRLPPLCKAILTVFGLLLPTLSFAIDQTGETSADQSLNLTHHWGGYLVVLLFVIAYILAMLEEITDLRKSKPMVFAASLIWVIIAGIYAHGDMTAQAGAAFRTTLEAYAELFLFILVSMSYLNAMEDRGVFERLRVWLLNKGFNYRQLFWITGFLSFFISSACNNLTTALLMGSVILAMGKDNRRFVSLSCVNVVVATNAGGSFSPFGDITTLLVWQRGVVPFADFFSLLIPALVNFIVPAALMYFWIPEACPVPIEESQPMKRGGIAIIVLFILTIMTSACFENFLHLPPTAGMMMGLTYLKFFSYYLQKIPAGLIHSQKDTEEYQLEMQAERDLAVKDLTVVKEGYIDYFGPMKIMHRMEKWEHDREEQLNEPFDVFTKVANLEWDTLLFFYGVMVAVGGLSFIGYLELTSQYLYTGMDPTIANILVGFASAFVDNGTIMLAVLTMAPDISQGQWLLVTLTAGVGGSMLAVGSAAGVGLMGQTKGLYTFTSHLKWTPAIVLGFFASIGAHFLINGHYFIE
ncbi:sodium:proton antiporter NhaD [Methylomicrobium album]|uniref:Na+/H+ antiporter NhaD-like permease n=1 Tax=Methylomicrobium album BG8 TaxID=686340 RepID=H8GMA0_METAL|nr:Na+/H+ antiporter NhaD-like permease [Methylomicrobium album BG8]